LRTTRKSGQYLVSNAGGERIRAFLPAALPPSPALDLGGMFTLYDTARGALGRLDGLTAILPAVPLFLYMYIRKEALLSSQIEGTQSSLSDLLLFESDELPVAAIDDVAEVSNYVAAMQHGLKRLAEGFPLSLRLLREMHSILLQSGRGASKQPGEFRRTQNWIGGTRPGNAIFVPPPPDQLGGCLDSFEKFLHLDQPELPPLIKAGLAHVQFETIHPFLDGNGRLGRLLVTLMLCEAGVLRQPMLYLSLYLKMHRAEYYRLLQEVRENGAWEAWVEFYLTGVRDTAGQAIDTAGQIMALFKEDRNRIEGLRRATSAYRMHELLQRRPVVTIQAAAKTLDLSVPTITKALDQLVGLDIVAETTGRRRNRAFGYRKYLTLLDRGTEPLSLNAGGEPR
jgi:Fic family protein